MTLQEQYNELLESSKQLTEDYLKLKAELEERKTKLALPSQLTPSQYTWVLNHLKEQRKLLQQAAKHNLPKELK